MTEEKIAEIIKIGDIHLRHLIEAIDDMAAYSPFSEDFIINMSKNDLRTLDTLTGRFGKLQDLVGAKIIDIYLQKASEPMSGKSIIDKINKLEKLGIIEKAEIWIQLRDVRNHIFHEYPNNPKLAAQHLNNVYSLAPELIKIYRKLTTEIKRLP